VVGYSSQPFWLRWHDGRRRRHAPDFFVRLIDGTGVVVDVRADDRIEVRDAEAFAATERACTQVGWRFRRVGVLDSPPATGCTGEPSTQALASAQPPPRKRRPPRPRTLHDDTRDFVDAIIGQDLQVPSRRRHSANESGNGSSTSTT
jgi:hypothetical protein